MDVYYVMPSYSSLRLQEAAVLQILSVVTIIFKL